MFVVLGLLLLIIIIVLILIFGGADKRKERREELKEEERKQKEEKAELKKRNKEAKKEARKYVNIFEQDDKNIQKGHTEEAKDFIGNDEMMNTSEIDEILKDEPKESIGNTFEDDMPESELSSLFDNDSNSNREFDSGLWDDSDNLWRENREAEIELEKEKQLREELKAAEEAERAEKERIEMENAKQKEKEEEKEIEEEPEVSDEDIGDIGDVFNFDNFDEMKEIKPESQDSDVEEDDLKESIWDDTITPKDLEIEEDKDDISDNFAKNEDDFEFNKDLFGDIFDDNSDK